MLALPQTRGGAVRLPVLRPAPRLMSWMPAGRRPPECPGACSCDAVCGVAVHEGRVPVVPAAELERLRDAGKLVMDDAYKSKCHYEAKCAEVERLREALNLAIHRGQFDRGTAVALKDAFAEADG